MSGNKLYNAQRACYLLHEAFKSCNIKLDFYAFNGEVQRVPSIDAVLKLYSRGGTDTQKAVEEIAPLKSNNPNTKKINLVLTDGCDMLDASLVRDLEKKNGCKFVGIGLGLSGDEHMTFKNEFDEHVLVNNPDDLPVEFIKLCKKLIL